MRSKQEIQPFLRVNTRHHQLTFNRAVHDLLGKPPCFMFYWRKDKNALYVASQVEEIQHAYAIPLNTLKSTTLEIHCSRAYLFENLQRRMGWQPNRVYKTYGSFDQATGMVCFPLENMQIMGGTDL